MKIRYDFVTNSSSTSFVIINDGEFNFKDFINAIGIDKNSQFIDIYKELFNIFKNEMQPAEDYYNKSFSHKYSTFEEFVKKYFTNGVELYNRIIDEQSKGKKVFMGSLRSESDDVESFFCTDEVLIDSPKLFIDATDHSW